MENHPMKLQPIVIGLLVAGVLAAGGYGLYALGMQRGMSSAETGGETERPKKKRSRFWRWLGFAALKVGTKGHPIRWQTSNKRRVVQSLESLRNGLLDGTVRHVGNAALTRHVLNERYPAKQDTPLTAHWLQRLP